ncbi:MAG: hypothetical protein J7L04_02275 [Bacteroidales bacterium]|nr:hypothetical protein [Bacteroidales bacterium]
MRTLMLILFTFLMAGCEKELPLSPDNVPLGAFIKDNYMDDARQLYLREILDDPNHPNYNEAVLDTNKINEILGIFQLVYNLKSPVRDTVYDIYKIHALPCYSLQSIGLKVNTTAPEIINLVNGQIPTGNNALDNILIKYEFDSVRTAYSYPDFPWLSIYTKSSYNLKPLIKAIEEVPSVILAENNGGCFDGNDIKLERNSNKATISFSIGRGDCWAGCIYRRFWIFHIENNRVKYIKTSDN